MPGFRSLAQRRRLQRLTVEGKFPQAEFDELDRDSPHDLPERATAQRDPRLSQGGSERYDRASKQRLY
jgi:hypothetical protein